MRNVAMQPRHCVALLATRSLYWYANAGFLDCVTQSRDCHDCMEHIHVVCRTTNLKVEG